MLVVTYVENKIIIISNDILSNNAAYILNIGGCNFLGTFYY